MTDSEKDKAPDRVADAEKLEKDKLYPESTHLGRDRGLWCTADSRDAQDSGIGSSQFSISRLAASPRSPALAPGLVPNCFSTPLNTNGTNGGAIMPTTDFSSIGRSNEVEEDKDEEGGSSVSASASSESESRRELPSRRRKKKHCKCTYCEKGFDRPSLLLRHIFSHTGERPFPCRFCSKAFSTRSGVNTHERIHTGDKPYVCKICGRRFAAGSNLIFHTYTHSNIRRHRCAVCPKAFVTPGDLRKHMYTHNGEWPFRCPECNRGFATERSLNNHQGIHTGVKPFSCHLCKKSYTQESSLKTHMRVHKQEFSARTNQSNGNSQKDSPQQCCSESLESTSSSPCVLAQTPASKGRSSSTSAQMPIVDGGAFSRPRFPITALPIPPSQTQISSTQGAYDPQILSLQHRLSRLYTRPPTEELRRSECSAFVDLRQPGAPWSWHHVLQPPRINPLTPQEQVPRPDSPESTEPIDLSVKKKPR